jgi:hypothetical protein
MPLERVEAVLERVEHFRFRMVRDLVSDKKKRTLGQVDLFVRPTYNVFMTSAGSRRHVFMPAS